MTLISIYGKLSDDFKNHFVTIILMVIFINAITISTEYFRDQEEKAKLATEVRMTEVPVGGEETFMASLKITYHNGKLDGVELIKGSTKPLTQTVTTLP